MVYNKGKRQLNPKNRKSQNNVKRHGKKADMAEFVKQLDALGLKIVEVAADGNCFFRALADQLEGKEYEHPKYRALIVEFIVAHRDNFEPFIEDEVPFDEYCTTMGVDGTWAGHMELQAASLLTKRNICIHKLKSPRWYINNFNNHEATMIHLCYHDGEHYNSVRLKEDPCQGPAMAVTLKVDKEIPKVNNNPETSNSKSNRSTQNSSYSVDLVMAATGCFDRSKVQQILEDMDGDVESAIECTLAMQLSSDKHPNEMELIDYDREAEEKTCSLLDGENVGTMAAETSTQDLQKSFCEPPSSSLPESSTRKTPSLSGKSKKSEFETSEEFDKSKREKNSRKDREFCSCGSAKKHKPSCQLSTVKSSKAPVMRGKGAHGKAKKGKREHIDEPPIDMRPCGRPVPDLGALCI